MTWVEKNQKINNLRGWGGDNYSGLESSYQLIVIFAYITPGHFEIRFANAFIANAYMLIC